jgi:hypothetical protein
MLAGPDIFDLVLPAHNEGASIARTLQWQETALQEALSRWPVLVLFYLAGCLR